MQHWGKVMGFQIALATLCLAIGLYYVFRTVHTRLERTADAEIADVCIGAFSVVGGCVGCLYFIPRLFG